MRRSVVLAIVCSSSLAVAQPTGAQPGTAPPVSEPAPAPVPEVDAVPDAPPDETTDAADLGFGFGSYGRVGVATDLDGGTSEQAKVVSHPSRIGEATYLELDLYYRGRSPTGVRWQTVTTMAFAGELFHYDGQWGDPPAIRNLYAQAERGGAGVWIGSRMYRGDDIYLLDYWPLDDLNTIGGGAYYRDERWGVAVHAGANRLVNDFQFQERDVSDPEFGATTITQLDRQRLVASVKGDARVWGAADGPAVKVKAYAEVQSLPEGTRLRADNTAEELPSDFGLTLGAQVGAWGFGPGATHANLFARLSLGLAAFDELAPPVDFDATLETFPKAKELVLGWSGNYEIPRGGVMVGGYARRFVDADQSSVDYDDGWEYVIDVRPRVGIWQEVGAAIDLSYQARFPRGISAASQVALDPAIWQVAPMLLYSPSGWSSYARPELRLIYRVAGLNRGARDIFPLDDPRRDAEVIHYLGLQAEWWFNSTYR